MDFEQVMDCTPGEFATYQLLCLCEEQLSSGVILSKISGNV